MSIDDIKRILSEVYPVSCEESDARKLSTAIGTFEIFESSAKNPTGAIKGNRLNSGKLRSQLMFFQDAKMWNEGDQAARKALRSDQRAFVQVGSDEWDVYVGKTMDGGSEPDVWQHITGLKNFLSDFSNLALTKGAVSQMDKQLQRIVYGAPGTGKSHMIDKCTNESNSIRVTFHPDTDYAAFVGAYKPTMDEQEHYALDATGTTHKIEAKEKTIVYSFVPQAFMKAYVKAWRRYTNDSLEDDAKTYYLVIEEINRGNCAQIFGDLFQLLDRADNGFSAYAITPDDDIQKFLEKDKEYKLADIPLVKDIKKTTEDGEKVIATAADIKVGKKLVLPPNLCIWATMNTSDQSLFPIDSAFKRRWDWKYVPIREGKYKDGPKKGQKMGWKIKFNVPAHQEGGQQIPAKDYSYDWWEFLKNINAKIFKTTESEDKKLGYFFVKPDGEDATTNDGTISADRFVGKVIFYLWNDVFKDYGIETIFKADDAKKSEDEAKGVEFQSFFNEEDDKADVNTLLKFFKHIELQSDEEIAAAQTAQQQSTATVANQQGQNANP